MSVFLPDAPNHGWLEAIIFILVVLTPDARCVARWNK
jgi:hypothetical protein